MTSARAPRTGERLGAAVLDGAFVVAPLVAVAAGLGMAALALDAIPVTPAGRDLVAFGTLVGPVAVATAWFESRPGGATPGKARRGLRVVDAGGDPVSPARALARSALRFAPWQAAHTAVFQLTGGSEDPVWLVVSLAAQGTVVVSWLLVARHGVALHDLLTGTRVVADVGGRRAGVGRARRAA